MSDASQNVTLNTSLGEAVAVRGEMATTGQREWNIAYPWGDDRFYGTKGEVTKRMRANIAENDVDA